MDDEPNIITSPLSRKFTRNGITIEILIYRLENDPAWQLEVVDPEGGSTVWEDLFATEQDALNEVFQTIASDGIGSFLRDPNQKLH
jgi:RPA family protein